MKKIFLSFLLILIFLSIDTKAQDIKPIIYQINIKENIGSNTWIYLRNGIYEAHQQKANAILLHMNTYGGAVLEADSMRTAILNTQIPVYVYIDVNAASAGALIAIACDSIYMRSSSSIGAATGVEDTIGTKAPDKYPSYKIATMRDIAESTGRTITVEKSDTIAKWRRDPVVVPAMDVRRLVISCYTVITQVLI